MNKNKSFVVQFECAPDTRWLYSDNDLASCVRTVAASVAIAHSTGPQPKVTVSQQQDEEKTPASHVS